MSDLHKPLSGKKSASSSNLLKAGVFLAGLGALSLAAYVLFDANRNDETVVALGTEVEGTNKPANTSNGQEENVPGIDVPGSANPIKPLEPLLPLPGANPNPQPVQQPQQGNAPAFRPQKGQTSPRNAWASIPDLIEKSEFGPLPRISTGGVRPLDAHSRSTGAVGANRVAIVVGGLGLSQTGTQQAIQQLPDGITLGFSPFGNSLQRWMQEAIKNGHEIILQLPMEPLGYPTVNPGPQTLTASGGEGSNIGKLRWLLGRVTNYPLTMNYLGANLTNNDAAIRPILNELKARGLGFLDDGSAQSSIAVQIADEIRLPHLKGDIVLDANQNASAVRNSLAAVEALARQKGFAVATAAAFPETVKIIAEWAENAKKRGILIVPVSNLLRDYRR